MDAVRWKAAFVSWLVCLGGFALMGPALCAAEAKLDVYRDFRKHPTEYAGPGRNDPEPADVKEVLIGYFGPSDPEHADGGDLWRAAQMAVDEANRGGGFRGKPFRLVPAWADNPWTAGVAAFSRLVFRDKVWAVIGGIDGPTTHLAEQIVVKARLPLVSPVSTDKTVNLVNVPWMFSCAPGDHLLTPPLAKAIAARAGRGPLVLALSDAHDARLFSDELGKRLAEQRIVPQHRFEFDRSAEDLEAVAGRIIDAKPQTVVLLAETKQSARLAVLLRRRGFTGALFGGPGMARRRFAEEAGSAAEGAVFPLLCAPDKISAEFVQAFQDRYHVAPDGATAQTYDAAQLLLAAIRQGGLNRARIRDGLHDIAPYPGVAGPITWDPAAANTRVPVLGTVRNGKFERLE